MNEFQKILEALNNINTLKRFNIVIHEFGYVLLKQGTGDYAYEGMIKDLRDQHPFFTEPSSRQVATLALAIYQEERNRYIDQEEIDTVNKLLCLDKPITMDEVQKFNSNYI